MSRPRIATRPDPGLIADKARDIRARAWSYVFSCFERHQSKEGGHETASDSRKGGSENDSTATASIP